MSIRAFDVVATSRSKRDASLGKLGRDHATVFKPFFCQSRVPQYLSSDWTVKGPCAGWIGAPAPRGGENSFHDRVLKCAESVFRTVNTKTLQKRITRDSTPDSPGMRFEKADFALMSAILAAKFVLSVSSCVPQDVSGLVDRNFGLESHLTAGTELLIFEQFNFGYICGSINDDTSTTHEWSDVDSASMENASVAIQQTIKDIQKTLNDSQTSAACGPGDSSCVQEKFRVRPDPSKDRIYWNIGKGGFGTVDMIRLSPLGQFRARKTLRFVEADALSMSVIREISLMTELNHDNVVGLIEVGVLFSNAGRSGPGGASVCLYMEPMMDLKRMIEARDVKGGLTDGLVLPVVGQLLKGIAYIHSQGLVHRDLKPQNILCSNDGKVKVADLGSLRYTNSKNPGYMDPLVCTFYYKAPELVVPLETGYGTPVDMWSAGCTIYELATNRVLFPIKSEQPEAHMKVIEARLGCGGLTDAETLCLGRTAVGSLVADFRLLAKGLSEDGRENVLTLLQALMKYNPGSRPSAQECVDGGHWLDYIKTYGNPWDPDGNTPHYVLEQIFGTKYQDREKERWKTQRGLIA